MKGVFFAGGAVGLALVIGLALAGGISFKREIDYVECERFAHPLASVQIQSSPRGAAWGNPRIVELASYGPPYDLLIIGTLPEGNLADSFEITDLIVEADGASVVSLPRVVVPVEDVLVRASGEKKQSKGFLFTARAFTSATPARLRVAGTLIPLSATREKGQRFTHVFEARRTRRLALGRWTWLF
jgi:hypothetical protein